MILFNMQFVDPKFYNLDYIGLDPDVFVKLWSNTFMSNLEQIDTLQDIVTDSFKYSEIANEYYLSKKQILPDFKEVDINYTGFVRNFSGRK